jgi:hypothetical protein
MIDNSPSPSPKKKAIKSPPDIFCKYNLPIPTYTYLNIINIQLVLNNFGN